MNGWTMFFIWLAAILGFATGWWIGVRIGEGNRIHEDNQRLWNPEDCHHPRYSGHGFE